MATEKQKLAFELSLKNTGDSLKDNMLEAGYGEVTADKPKNLTESKGWQELCDKYIPEDLLQQKLKEGLDATKGRGDNQEDDYAVRHKYLDTAFKLRGSYAAEKKDVNIKGIADVLNDIENE